MTPDATPVAAAASASASAPAPQPLRLAEASPSTQPPAFVGPPAPEGLGTAAATAATKPAAVVTATDAVAAPVAATAVVAAPATTAAKAVTVTAPTALATTIPAPAIGMTTPAAAGTWPMLGALLLIVGLILGLGRLVKRLQGAQGPKSQALSIKAGLQLGQRERVVWMQAGETHLLLSVTPGRVQTLHVFDVPPDFDTEAASAPASRDFSQRLKQMLEKARARGLAVDRLAPAAAASAPPAAAAAASASVAATAAAAEAPRAPARHSTFSFRA